MKTDQQKEMHWQNKNEILDSFKMLIETSMAWLYNNIMVLVYFAATFPHNMGIYLDQEGLHTKG